MRFQVQDMNTQHVTQRYVSRAALFDIPSQLYIYVDVWQGTEETYRPRESPKIEIKIGAKSFTFENETELLKALEKNG